MPSTRYNTALSYIEIFNTLSIESHQSLFTPTYRHDFAPASVSPPPTQNKDEFAAHLAGLQTVLKGFPVTAKDVVEDEHANRVVIWATSEAQFHDHLMDGGIPAEDWAYKGEYIFILTMDASGGKVDKVLEFVDSKGTERLRGLIKRAKANQ